MTLFRCYWSFTVLVLNEFWRYFADTTLGSKPFERDLVRTKYKRKPFGHDLVDTNLLQNWFRPLLGRENLKKITHRPACHGDSMGGVGTRATHHSGKKIIGAACFWWVPTSYRASFSQKAAVWSSSGK